MLLRADRAELAAGLPGRLGPAPEQGEGLIGVGVGAEVEIIPEPPQQGVAHGAADEMKLMPGGGEAPAQLVGDGRYAQQLGYRTALGLVKA